MAAHSEASVGHIVEEDVELNTSGTCNELSNGTNPAASQNELSNQHKERTKNDCYVITEKITPSQRCYIIRNAIGGAIINGAIIGLISWAMYKNKCKDVWKLPDTVVGDMTVTVFLVCAPTWVLTSAFVWRDVLFAGIPALHSPRFLAAKSNKWLRYWLVFDGLFYICLPCEKDKRPADNPKLFYPGFLPWIKRIILGFIRGAILGVPCWLILFPVTLAIAIPISNNNTEGCVDGWPDAFIFKATLGVILGGLVTTLIVWFTLCSTSIDISSSLRSATETESPTPSMRSQTSEVE